MGDIKQVGPKAITAATGATSYVALEDAIAFTPTFANFTIGNGSVWGAYQTINDVCYISCGFFMGSTSSVSGALSLSALPETSTNHTNGYYPVPLTMLDSGTGFFGGYLMINPNATATQGFRTNADAAVNATVPHTWAVNDSLTINGSYPIN